MSQSDRQVTRRRLLGAVGTSVVGLTAGSGIAAAQDDGGGGDGGSDKVAVPAIMPETGEISADEDYTGFMLKLDSQLEQSSVGDIGGCTVEGWSPSTPLVFETQVVDTVNTSESDSYEVIPSSAYLPQDTSFGAGDLFIINNQSQCADGFLGIQLENIRSSENPVSYDFSRESDGGGGGGGGGSDAIGPGFGPLAAVGGVLGGAYGLARRGSDEE
ncbi:hypothetical protein ACFPYI_08880 [Halomarina salina]|uniref:PGF-CTERM sorting domain-containing protein n=1 Tax=Halomarina salina TaxID=1872699 RepID=A0ABD5RLC6_9EURY|nr:hypothetical protein [Halomarina salina]